MNDLEKLTDCELWEVMNGVTTVLSAHPPKASDKVFCFWYDVYKNIESEINKRLLSCD